ncbi:MAG: methyltransferase domain-containing protein [Planctomycetes bacterium]|nr:methyltransferase domain-containing protein [Planctomycetota bacterium]
MALGELAHVGDADAVRAQHAAKRVQQNASNAEQFGDGARVLATRAAETDQDVVAHVVSAGDRDFSDGRDHVLVCDLDQADRKLLALVFLAGRRVDILDQCVEPADNVAAAAITKGVATRVRFFGTKTAQDLVQEGIRADLLIANNVLAHVPNLNDFVAGMKLVLSDDGVITVEFPHLVRLIEGNQFDTIYQEHYCYFSFFTLERVFAAHGLTIFDVEELPTHGGSLRIYARHTADESKPVLQAAVDMRNSELNAGYNRLETYATFAEQVAETKRNLLEFLIQAKRDGKQVAAYGAPGKGNTLLNYCGIRQDFIDYAVDRNPYKHGRFLPGTHIPVFSPEKIAETRPDYILILPWNLRDEITRQLRYVREWGGKFVVPIPKLEVF